jgi:hypothetical protein
MSRQKTAYLVLCAFLLFLLPHAAAAAAGCGALPEWFTGVPSIPTFEPRNTCQFQQWAWQAFLALLQTDGSQQTPLYFTWPLPKNSIYDLYCERVCHSDARLPPNPCNPPTQKEFVNATTQPGFVSPTTSGELIDQAGKPVYFTSHVSPEWVDFITRRQLYDNKVLESANPHLAFRAGAFEIKTSWRFTSGMSPAENAQYYTTTACVAPEDHSTPFPAELALVGFHITGGAPGHPELLWATFEHARNAPDCDATPAPGKWSFYDGKTNCRTQECNQPNPKGGSDPVNVCRKLSYGGASPQTAHQIAGLNEEVHNRLPRESKWRFYDLIGTVWGNDPRPQCLEADSPVPCDIPPAADTSTFNLQEPSGSPLLSNTSLETFKQNVSCFGCHNAQFPGEFASIAGGSPAIFQNKNLFASHVVLFSIFFAADECAQVCPNPAGLAGKSKR